VILNLDQIVDLHGVARNADLAAIHTDVSVKVNDLIQVKDHATSKTIVQKNVEGSTSRVVPDWVRLDRDALSAALLRIPSRDEINPIANEQAVVEFYSR